MNVPNEKRTSNIARVLGSGCTGVIEMVLFHPMDTMAKRLMYNQQRVSLNGAQGNLSQVLFKEYANGSVARKYYSLFPGFGFGLMFKVSQRVYRYAGQLIVRDYLTNKYGYFFQRHFGEKYARPMVEATAGSLIGAGEVILLPLDILKIKMQTNPQSLKGRGMYTILRQEGITKLYRGSVMTAARNAPGSFALFGGA